MYNIRVRRWRAAPSSRLVLPTPINLLGAGTLRFVASPVLLLLLFFCTHTHTQTHAHKHTSTHAQAHAHTDTHSHKVLQFYSARQIYFSFYFSPQYLCPFITRVLALSLSLSLPLSSPRPRPPLPSSPCISFRVYICASASSPLAAASVCLTGAQKTRRSPAEWRHHQRQVVFNSGMYIFAREHFTIWPFPSTGGGPTNGWHLFGQIDARTAVLFAINVSSPADPRPLYDDCRTTVNSPPTLPETRLVIVVCSCVLKRKITCSIQRVHI